MCELRLRAELKQLHSTYSIQNWRDQLHTHSSNFSVHGYETYNIQ